MNAIMRMCERGGKSQFSAGGGVSYYFHTPFSSSSSLRQGVDSSLFQDLFKHLRMRRKDESLYINASVVDNRFTHVFCPCPPTHHVVCCEICSLSKVSPSKILSIRVLESASQRELWRPSEIFFGLFDRREEVHITEWKGLFLAKVKIIRIIVNQGCFFLASSGCAREREAVEGDILGTGDVVNLALGPAFGRKEIDTSVTCNMHLRVCMYACAH